MKYSSLTIDYKNCSLCHLENQIKIRNRLDAYEILRQDKLEVCELCKEYSIKYKYEGITKDIDDGNLTDLELSVLKGIVRLKSKMMIYRHLFNDDLENKIIWKTINGLEKKGFIWIVGN